MNNTNLNHPEEQLCDDPTCTQCCEHYETDHDICMDCGKELDPGATIDRAMDSMDDDR